MHLVEQNTESAVWWWRHKISPFILKLFMCKTPKVGKVSVESNTQQILLGKSDFCLQILWSNVLHCD